MSSVDRRLPRFRRNEPAERIRAILGRLHWQLLNSAGIFAAGYLMRPVGSILMRVHADRKGRRAALSVALPETRDKDLEKQ